MDLNPKSKHYAEALIIIVFLSVTLCFCVGYCIARRYNV
jgi:hypothetical protein